MPTLTNVYETPAISGRVIDIVDLVPASSIPVQHDHPDAKPVLTDADGNFTLPAIVVYQATVKMAGHALNDYIYFAVVEIDGGKTLEVPASVSATMKMYHQEQKDGQLLLIDSQPDYSLSAISPKGVTFAEIDAAGQIGGAIARCDSAQIDRAVTSLALYRKSTTINSLQPSFEKSAISQAYISWQQAYRSCLKLLDDEDYTARRQLHDFVERVALDFGEGVDL